MNLNPFENVWGLGRKFAEKFWWMRRDAASYRITNLEIQLHAGQTSGIVGAVTRSELCESQLQISDTIDSLPTALIKY